ERPDRVGGTYVERQQLAREAFELVRIEIGGHHVASLARERLGRGASDTRAGCGDQCLLLFQSAFNWHLLTIAAWCLLIELRKETPEIFCPRRSTTNCIARRRPA